MCRDCPRNLCRRVCVCVRVCARTCVCVCLSLVLTLSFSLSPSLSLSTSKDISHQLCAMPTPLACVPRTEMRMYRTLFDVCLSRARTHARSFPPFLSLSPPHFCCPCPSLPPPLSFSCVRSLPCIMNISYIYNSVYMYRCIYIHIHAHT